jgi:hypothetical protein
MTDVFKDMPRFSWRGIEVPIVARDVGFTHANAQHTYVFRDQQVIEPLGAKNWTFRYTLPMRQGIARGPYRDLFLEVLPRLIDACRDRSAGELYDPVLGFFRCQPVDFSSTTDFDRRDGEDVTVEFLWSPEEGEIDLAGADLGMLPTARQEGAALDAQVDAIFRSRQLPSPEPSVNPLDAITGIVRQIGTYGQQVQAGFAAYATKIQNMEAAIVALEEPDLAPTIRASRNLRDAARQRAAKVLDPLGTVRTLTTDAASNVAAIASAIGLTPEELLEANPSLAQSPEVPAGTLIRFVPKS